MRTEFCQSCRLWHAEDRGCRESLELGEAWLVKPPVDEPIEPEPAIVKQESDNPIIGTITLKRRGRPPKK